MRFIAGLRLFAVAGILSLSLAGAASAAEVTKFKVTGNTAFVNSSDGTTSVDMNVTQDDTSTTAPVTNIFFSRTTCGTDSCDGTFGFGIIPSNDFKAASKMARLNTNLATNSGLTMFSFHDDLATGERTQTPITPTGVIIMEWKQSPRDSTKFDGTTTRKAGPLTTITRGVQYSTQAKATGSFVGTPVQTETGRLGSTKNADITIFRD